MMTQGAAAVGGVLLGALLSMYSQGSSKKFNQNGDVIVQLFEWSWKEIAVECSEFLRYNGYTAVQTSPVTENAVLKGRPWHERYQPFSYKMTTRSGNEEDFKNMVKVCNKYNIKVYVDVVLNHMSANLTNAVGTAGSQPDTLKKKYPDYAPHHFHKSCPIEDWNNPWQVRNCELLGFHDLDQSIEYVRYKTAQFLDKLIDIGVAGFRVGAAKHIDVEDLENIFSRVKNLSTTYFPANTRPYIYQEVAGDQNVGAILPSDYFKVGSVMDFKFGFELSQAFRGKTPLKWLKREWSSWGFLPWNHSVVFIDNHDTQRRDSLSFKEKKLYKMAVGFMLAWPHSVAKVMSSFSFNYYEGGPPSGPVGKIVLAKPNMYNYCTYGWVCEHRWRQISNMALFRHVVYGSEVSDWWDNGGNQIAFGRKGKGFVAFNMESFPLNATLQTSLPGGLYCDVISGHKYTTTLNEHCTGKMVRVDANGRVNISLPHNEKDGMLAIHIESKLSSEPMTEEQKKAFRLYF